MKNIYSNSEYLQMNKTWHVEHSPWKAEQIMKIIKTNNLEPKKIVEVGCGVGEILFQLNQSIDKSSVSFTGYDIAKDAINIAKKKQEPNIDFFCKDFTCDESSNKVDLLLMIDVFEHVPNYIDFIKKCSKRADYKIFHIPLDIHVSSILRNRIISTRKSVGHLHYFTKETALATLEDSGLKVLDYFYTKSSEVSTNLKTKIVNIPRKLLFSVLPDFTVKLFGGYSLLVLAK